MITENTIASGDATLLELDVRIVTSAGKETALSEAAIEEFKTSFRGKLIYPGDSGYDEARKVYNAMIDKRPALMVQCAGVSDVIVAVKFARTNNLLVAIRGAGHNVAGTAICEGSFPGIQSLHLKSINNACYFNYRKQHGSGICYGRKTCP